MPLRLPQAELVAAVSTNSPHNWGSLQLTYGAQFRASVHSTRARRDLSRTGFVYAKRGGTAPDSLTPSGFGPFGPVVIGQPIVRGRNRYQLNRDRTVTVPMRKAIYYLWDPQAIGQSPIFPPPKIIRNSSRLQTDVERAPHSKLRKPTRVAPAPTYIPDPKLYVYDAWKLQIRVERVTERAPKSKLYPPLVVDGNPTYAGPAVRLTEPADAQDIYWRRQPKSFLYPPTVVADAPRAPEDSTVDVTLVRITPPPVMSRLSPPTVIDLSPQVYYLSTTLAKITPPPVTAKLSPPTDTAGLEDQGKIRVTLVRITPPRTLAGVRRPRRVAAPVAYLRPVKVTLAYSSRGRPKSTLRPPATLERAQAFTTGIVSLAPSRRLVAKSALHPPTLIDLTPQVYYLSVALARIRPPKTMSRLAAPTDTVGLEDQGSVRVHLAYSSRGKPKSRLSPPTDTVGLEDQGRVKVTLAPSPRQGRRTRSELSPPAVVIPNTPHRGIMVELARTPRQYVWMQGYGIAGVRRPRFVRAATPFLRPIEVTLARIRPARIKSRLAPPTVVRPAPISTAALVQLATIKPARVNSKLRRPAVVTPAPPADAVADITLVQTRPRPIRSTLRPPAVVGPVLAPPILTSLAPSSRLGRRQHSHLSPPAVVRIRVYPPQVVSLAPQARRPGRALLSPPAVIFDERYYGPAIHLTYSSRGKPWYGFTPHTGEIPPSCYGKGVGIVSAAAENRLEMEPSAEATSTTAPGAAAASSIVAPSTIQSTRPGAENYMTDEQREGC